MNDEDRKEVLLKATFELLKKCYENPYAVDITSETVFYDDADCDGLCLMRDIAAELGINEEEAMTDNHKRRAIAKMAERLSGREQPMIVGRLREEGLSDDHILAVLHAIDEICNQCWDYPGVCTCRRDD